VASSGIIPPRSEIRPRKRQDMRMCFSASASFIAATTLAVAGIATMRIASRPSQMPFAAVPLLFGIQQFIEGLIWLSFDSASPVPNPPLTFVYSLFSHVLWPIYVPFAIRMLEPAPRRRWALLATQGAGILVGFYLLYFLVQFPVSSRVLGQHIVYESPHFYQVPVMALYLIATCASSMLARHRLIRLFGLLSLVTFLAAYAIHAATLVSVWCFFAAVLSFIVYVYFHAARAVDSSASSSSKAAKS
jgi:hypothetical protein